MLRGFQSQLLALFLPLLMGVQLITLVVVQDATRQRLVAQSGEALSAVSTSFSNWLRDTVRRLADSSAILAADFGFRSAIASRDTPTIATAIENARRRIGADAAMVIELDGQVIASAGSDGGAGAAFAYPHMLRDAEQDGRAASIILLGGRLMEFVLVPVTTPDLAAWIGIGVEVGARTARVLRDQSAVPVDLSFAVEKAGQWHTWASSLAGTGSGPLDSSVAAVALCQSTGSNTSTIDLELPGGNYSAAGQLLATAPGTPRACMVIHRSLDEALAPYQPLFHFLWTFCFAGCAAGALIAIVIARNVTKPISRLASAAAAMQDGAYPEPVAVSGPIELSGLAAAFNSMVDGIAEREQEIFRQANFDALTGLPNRQHFEQLLAGDLPGQRAALILLIHVENLRIVSNTLGHDLGDRVIAESSRRIVNTFKQGDVLCRFDADKFVLLLRGGAGEVSEAIARRVQDIFEQPIAVSGINVDISIRMGMAEYPAHGDTHRVLLRKAEVALATARNLYHSYSVYEAANDPYKAEQLSLIGELRDSMDDGTLSLHYQPKIDAESGRITQAEALMRWQSPSRGFVPPDEFILLAERTGFISRLTQWALARAAADCRRWRDQGHALKLSVNVSTRDLLDPGLPARFLATLAEHGLGTDAIAIEVTESSIMEQAGLALKSLAELAAAGVDIAIDDFGTGHSSMAYIGDMAAHELKIDKRFVLDLARNSKSQTIVRTMIQLGHSFGMRVCAEGVEDARTVELLRNYGCDYLQGWYYSKALPPEVFGALLERWRDSVFEPAASNVRSLRA